MVGAQFLIATGGSFMDDGSGKPRETWVDRPGASFGAFLFEAAQDVENHSRNIVEESRFHETLATGPMDEDDRVLHDDRPKLEDRSERGWEENSKAPSEDAPRSSDESGLAGGEVKVASREPVNDRKVEVESADKVDKSSTQKEIKTLEKRLRDHIDAGDVVKAKEILESLKNAVKSGKIDHLNLTRELSALLSKLNHLSVDDGSKALLQEVEGLLKSLRGGASAAVGSKPVSSREISEKRGSSHPEAHSKEVKTTTNQLIKAASSELRDLKGSSLLTSSAENGSSEATLNGKTVTRTISAGTENNANRTPEAVVQRPNPLEDLEVLVKKANGRLVGLKHPGSPDSVTRSGMGEKALLASETPAGQVTDKATAAAMQKTITEVASSTTDAVKDKVGLAAKDVITTDKKVSNAGVEASKSTGEHAKGAGNLVNHLASQENINIGRSSQTSSTSALSQSREATPSQLFRQIVQKAQVMIGDGMAEMKLELKPEQLGKLHLKLEMQGGMLAAKFVADSQQTKELIEANMSQLKQSFSDQGLNFGKIDVSVGGGERGDIENEENVPNMALATLEDLEDETDYEEGAYDPTMVAGGSMLEGATMSFLA